MHDSSRSATFHDVLARMRAVALGCGVALIGIWAGLVTYGSLRGFQAWHTAPPLPAVIVPLEVRTFDSTPDFPINYGGKREDVRL